MLSIKTASLALLCVWMTLLTVVMHISRTERPAGTPPYKPASAVILAELGKLLVSVLLAYRECKRALKQERERVSSSIFSSSRSNLLFDASEQDTTEGAGYETPPTRARVAGADAGGQDGVEEEKEGLLHPQGRAQSFKPALSRSNSYSSWSSAASDDKHGTGAGFHRTEGSTSEDDDTLPAYPGSPPHRIRSDFRNEEITAKEAVQRMKEDTFGPDWMKLSVPAFLFTGQSNLSYFASSNLSVPVFQITYQLKIPATALCSVLMLKRALSRMQWFSIVLLSLGVGIVQLASSTADKAHHPHSTSTDGSASFDSAISNPTGEALYEKRSSIASRATMDAASEHVEMNQMLGLLAIVLACLSSGFSGVFFERQLKRPAPVSSSPAAPGSNDAIARKTGLWIRNIQLSMFSLLVGSTIYAITSPSDIPDFLIGFSPIVWFVVFAQIVGGLLAAIVIQYADNIAKTFSASCSIILSFAVSIAFFDFQPSPGVILGSVAVLFATWLFTYSAPGLSKSVAAKSFLPTASGRNSPTLGKDRVYTQLPNSSRLSGVPGTSENIGESSGSSRHDDDFRRPSIFPWIGSR